MPAVERALLAALLSGGAAVRLWQYLGGASLWLDELAIARNIVGRPLAALLGEPLSWSQMAPQGFLLAEKLATRALGPSDPTLRLFPLLCGLAALPLFVLVARHLLRGPGLVLGTALFAFSPSLIFYSCEVKQYASDLAVALALLALALSLVRGSTSARRGLALGLSGAAAVWLSQAAVLVLAGIGAALAGFAGFASVKRRQTIPSWRPLALAFTPWGLSGAAAVLDGFRRLTPATHAFLQHFWRNGFMPMPPRSLHDAVWLWSVLSSELGRGGLDWKWRGLCVLVMLLGWAALWRAGAPRREAALLLLGPTGVALAASAAGQYPFQGRLIIFLVPTFLIGFAAGADAIRRWAARSEDGEGGDGTRARVPWGVAAGWTVFLVLAYPAAYGFATNLPVYRPEETRPMLAYVQAHRRPGDAIFAYYAAGQALGFYGPRYGLREGDYVVGRCAPADLRGYLGDVDRFRGRPRVWVLFSHERQGLYDQQLLVRYLDAIGVRRGAVAFPAHFLDEPPTVHAYLYDLSDPRRLATTSAGAFLPQDIERRPVDPYACAGPQSLTSGPSLGR